MQMRCFSLFNLYVDLSFNFFLSFFRQTQTASSRRFRSGELLGSGEEFGIKLRRLSRFGGVTGNRADGIEMAEVETTEDRLDDTPNENRRGGGRSSPSISSSSSNSSSSVFGFLF